ncbi:Rap1a/Tai family immunity protein [Nioella sp.]|uniref:Rap1a/Tai family immunity protein n=1 Tax=Nioella sp. TaxID=1912091 RepID=UPI003517C78E
MKKYLAKTTILVAFLVASFSAQAEEDSVVLSSADFADACTRANESWVSFCNGYAQALVDFATLSGNACIPDGTTRSEIITLIDSIAFDAISTNDIASDSPAFLVALSVIEAAFPCS